MAPITNEELFWLAQFNNCVNDNDLAVLIRVLRQIRSATELTSSGLVIARLKTVDFYISSAIRDKLRCRMQADSINYKAEVSAL